MPPIAWILIGVFGFAGICAIFIVMGQGYRDRQERSHHIEQFGKEDE